MFKEVPPYIRDLIQQVNRRYIDVPGSYIHLAFNLLEESQPEVLFLTLNYDEFIEQALHSLDPTYEFNTFAEYVHESRKAKVVKLHESTN